MQGYFNRFIGFWVVVCVAYGAHGVSDAQAAKLLVPKVESALIKDSMRFTLEWPESVFFKAQMDGEMLTLSFNRDVEIDTDQLLSRLSPYAESITKGVEPNTYHITLDRPYKMRSYVSDTVNGVHIMGVDASRAPKTDVGKALAVIQPLSELAPSAGEDAPPESTDSTEPAEQQAVAELAPSADESVTNAEVKTEMDAVPSAQEELSHMAPAQAPVLADPFESSEEEYTEDDEEYEEEADAQAPADTVAAPPEVRLPQAEPVPAVMPDGRVKVLVSGAEESAVIRFPFAKRMAMATFTRAGYVWVVFNEAIPFDLSDFDGLSNTVVGKAQRFAAPDATVLRIPVLDNMFPSVAVEEGSFNIALLINEQPRAIPTPLAPQINVSPSVPSHVVLETLEKAPPVVVMDPMIGDEMVVVPLYSIGEAVAIPRQFVEFSLLETAQGVAIVKYAEAVQVTPQRNGIRIGSQDGLVVTADLPVPEQKLSVAASTDTATLFPYEQWRSSGQGTLELELNVQQKRIIGNDDVQEANQARLRMAQLYLSTGLSAEAIGHIDNIRRTDRAYYRAARLAGMRGLANFMMYRFPEAAKDFSSPELNNNKEVEFWRALLADLLGSNDQTYDYLEMHDDYISKYPRVLRERLAVVSADRTIAAKRYNVALKIFDTLDKADLLDGVSHYIKFLQAKIALETGQEEDAFTILDELAQNYDRPFVRANAEYARIVWGMDRNAITREEAADRLERLRLFWRGDALELDILRLLGNIYQDQKDYINAMRVWYLGVTGFPNTSTAINMARRMQDVFITMFKEGATDNLNALDALAIYYEYRNYMPTGNAGNVMIEKLADRLIAVDLLEEASLLLDRQMRSQLEKEDRSRVGAKLATIYLLHKQPENALRALQDSIYGETSLDLRLYRNRLTAQSMIELGQYAKAMSTLGQDFSLEAEQMRVEIYWKRKDWPNLISSVEKILKERPDVTAPVTLDESEMLLKLALAYVFENNNVQLQYLRDYFGPLMQDNPYQEIFTFVTAADIKPTTTNFNELLENLSKTRSFLDGYKARIKTSGLDAMMAEK